MSDPASLLLTPMELQSLTGYRRPSAQLRELRRQGFVRARRSPNGRVILERAHYDAVCRGQHSEDHATARPRVRPAPVRVA
jgi:Domain of unknown function (DUF4224)